MMFPRSWIVCGAVLAGIGVLLGAVGAHGLENRLDGHELSDEMMEKLLDRYEVAVRYQTYHALGLIVVGLIASRQPSRPFQLAGYAFLSGVLFFSGFLYASVLTLGRIGWLVHVVPVGGVLMIAGWALFALGAAKLGRDCE